MCRVEHGPACLPCLEKNRCTTDASLAQGTCAGLKLSMWPDLLPPSTTSACTQSNASCSAACAATEHSRRQPAVWPTLNSASSSALSAARRSARRATMTSLHPASASRWAVARPMPELAPVMNSAGAGQARISFLCPKRNVTSEEPLEVPVTNAT